ncbi:hypothetical protein BLNAU_3931 [Blattamonas nauphoetae]|uniref:Uncharacterized protein n=1 Tax=Blattamonas nauphoetae TaxID=2049346 RepID=A0ABQ9YBW0_9EUKA|nr:hypothetical protein BLNAU_3931 [Blattamonas nauphoetae]
MSKRRLFRMANLIHRAACRDFNVHLRHLVSEVHLFLIQKLRGSLRRSVLLSAPEHHQDHKNDGQQHNHRADNRGRL